MNSTRYLSPVVIDIQTRPDPNQEALFYDNINIPDGALSVEELTALTAQAAVEYVKHYGFWHLLQDEDWWTDVHNKTSHKTVRVAAIDVRKAFVAVRNDAALVPELSAITCLSYWTDMENGGAIGGATTSPNDPEKRREVDLIGKFVALASTYTPIVIWNSWTLDTLLGRMGVLNIKPNFVIDRRPWGQDIVELASSRWVKGYKSKSLVWTAQALGIQVGPTNASHSGAEMPWLWEEKPDIVLAYSKERVAMIRAAFDRWSGIFFQAYNIDPSYNQMMQQEYEAIVQGLPPEYRKS